MRRILFACVLLMAAPAFAETSGPSAGDFTAEDIAAVRQTLFGGRESPDQIILAACCKTCSKGKPCGNSCIARNKRCHQPPGCAC